MATWIKLGGDFEKSNVVSGCCTALFCAKEPMLMLPAQPVILLPAGFLRQKNREMERLSTAGKY
ncbi:MULTISPECIES: hypothetical protein [Photorhabdus]|uniref:Uncharacterized protein n=3 Tax=Photorhabdus khanii TaxID=1004150 RepID=A0A4R4J7G8_9GAMM|nr:hypothetical protein [Photorhabdus khanii]ETS30222.1 hypothetical protein PTE_03561 [Photorhabdus khanii NC19]MQL47543.1 hypothetical protein [Photorhabdus khanii]OHV49414.1 hypothetical protein BB987_19720 [Photorhabdus temperata]TDB49222.1 hypothetical protein C5467_17755 [Photorhabdus khanii subsp. guanajuatensis]